MASLSRVTLNLADRIARDRTFRRRLFARTAQDEIAMQIRSLRDKHNLRQVDFAKAAGMTQSSVSRIEQADYSGWTFKTLLRIADTLGARLRVTFQPIEDVVAEYRNAEGHDYQAQTIIVDDETDAMSDGAAEGFTSDQLQPVWATDHTPTHDYETVQ